MDDMTSTPSIKRRLVNLVNRGIVGLQRLGLAFGPTQLLLVRGRKSGQPRTFPIAVIGLFGERYIFQAFPRAAWVANARSADTVTLRRGRTDTTVRLQLIPVADRPPLLRELVRLSARNGKRLVANGLAASPTPEGAAASADRIAVFKVLPAAA